MSGGGTSFSFLETTFYHHSERQRLSHNLSHLLPLQATKTPSDTQHSSGPRYPKAPPPLRVRSPRIIVQASRTTYVHAELHHNDMDEDPHHRAAESIISCQTLTNPRECTSQLTHLQSYSSCSQTLTQKS